MELINLTALAKMNRGTTPATRAKLDKLGINPAQEVEMPSGRKFVLFDKVKAVKALEKARADREKGKEMKAQEAVKKAAKKAAAPTQSRAGRGRGKASMQADAVTKELQELRRLTALMLEHMTRPQSTGD